MVGSLRSKVILNLLVANAIVLGILATWSEVERDSQEQRRQDYLFQMVGDRLQRFEQERAGDLSAIMAWPLWSEFADALIIDHRLVAVQGGMIPVGTYLNPLGASHREASYPMEEITAAMVEAVNTGESARVAHGMAVPLKESSGAHEAWAGVFVRPKTLPTQLPFSWQVILATAFATLTSAILVWLLLRKSVLQPIENLSAATHEFAVSRNVQMPAAAGVYEVDELLDSFRTMTGEIKGFHEELETEVEKATNRAIEAERRASKHDRLAAMGSLAAGLAHEINSPLAGAINGVLVLESEAQSEKGKRYGPLVQDALQRISGLVARMLRLAPARPEVGNCNLQSLVEDLQDFLASRLHDHKLLVDIHPQLDLPVAPGDLFPVMLNLLKNSFDALDKSDVESGIVNITANVNDGTATVRVSDNGPGATPEILEHLFEPFVTNKEVGSGTGLGLSLVHSTVLSWGGNIEARNLPDGGFEVSIKLPMLDQEIS